MSPLLAPEYDLSLNMLYPIMLVIAFANALEVLRVMPFADILAPLLFGIGLDFRPRCGDRLCQM